MSQFNKSYIKKKNLIPNIVLNGERNESISSEIRNDKRASTLTTYSTQCLNSYSNKARERNKRHNNKRRNLIIPINN
jgi:hypothetical protein